MQYISQPHCTIRNPASEQRARKSGSDFGAVHSFSGGSHVFDSPVLLKTFTSRTRADVFASPAAAPPPAPAAPPQPKTPNKSHPAAFFMARAKREDARTSSNDCQYIHAWVSIAAFRATAELGKQLESVHVVHQAFDVYPQTTTLLLRRKCLASMPRGILRRS